MSGLRTLLAVVRFSGIGVTMSETFALSPLARARRHVRPTVAIAGLILLSSLIAAAAQPQPATRPLRLLFIGNSLTAWNDLPMLVTRLAMADGQPQPLTRTVAVGGFSLEDHWNQGDAQRAIADGPWDFVVLQQGPSALLESRRLLVTYTRRFAEVIQKAGARPALYMVWPSTSRRQDFSGVSDSYRAAAKSVDGVLLSAGTAWSLVLQRQKSIALYSEDGLHPTIAGSYLAALVIYQGLYGRSPIGLPALGLSATDARALQDAAIDVRDPPVRVP
jgi:hypothetical protein